MLAQHAQLDKKWDAPAFVARVATSPNRPLPLQEREVLIADAIPAATPNAFRAYFHKVTTNGATNKPDGLSLPLPDSLCHLADGDIVRIVPRRGEVFVLYRRSSSSNVLFLTGRCNCQCVMCPQPPLNNGDDHQNMAECLEIIPLMDRGTPSLGITGGEPTLNPDGLIQVIRACRNYLPSTAVHILSNGRMFNYMTLCQALAQVQHPDLMIGIPLYSDIANRHDFIMQAQGTFDQALRGIMNLQRCGLRVEIRVVLHRLAAERLSQLSQFIARNLPFVSHVALMGMETMGYAAANLEALWVDPVDYAPALHEASTHLIRHRIPTSIYNHQLCVLPRDLWSLAVKSISDWKTEYLDQCQDCMVRGQCGGFFGTGRAVYSRSIRPVRDEACST